MVKVIAGGTVAQELREDAMKVFGELEKNSVKDDGCLGYEVFEALENPSEIVIIEEWADLPALGAHSKQAHFLASAKKLGELGVALKITAYKKII